MKTKIILFSTAVFTASFAEAVTFRQLTVKVLAFLNEVGILIILFGVFFLIYGIFKYVGSGGDEKKMVEARNLLFWGVGILFVMISMWGIVKIFQNTFFDPQDLAPQGVSDELFPF